MRPLQQDDIQDWLNEPKRKFRFIHTLTGKSVRAKNKLEAIILFKEQYNLIIFRKDIKI
jgi:hypothetical protein